MAEPPPPETPTAATRVYIIGLALACAFRAVDKYTWPTTVDSTISFAAGAALSIMDYKLPWLFAKVGPERARYINTLTADPRWWFAAVLAIFVFVGLSPVVNRLTQLRIASSHDIPPSLVRATPIIRSDLFVPVLRDPRTGMPFFVNVFFTIDSNLSLVDAVSKGALRPMKKQLSPLELDANFQILNAYIDFSLPDSEQEYVAKTRNQISLASEFFTDHDLESVRDGDSYLYVMVRWRYRLQDSSTVYVKDLCVFFTGTLENTKICPGTHNGTYKENWVFRDSCGWF